MAWKPIADRITTLPMVIAGPILRRVEKDSVSVWLALKEARTGSKALRLEVYDNGTSAIKGNLMLSGSRDTVSLGEHLHIVVLTATTSDITKWLKAERTYSYNVLGIAATATTDVGFTGNNDLCYPGFTLPTFSLPPADLNKLRIIHASCRKLHAEGTDAMADVDEILYTASNDPATMPVLRPHQLFLTGDQIYADDVDPLLLYLIRDLCEGADATLDVDMPPPHRLPSERKGLLNWQEEISIGTLPGPFYNPDDILGKSGEHIYENTLEVDRRSILLKKESGLHFPGEWEVVDNHLIKLGEYYGMYLLMWSPVLWPVHDDEYPGFRNVFSKKYFPEDPEPYQVPVGSDEVVAEQSSEKAGDNFTYSIFSRSVTRAKRYQDELRAVRRGLANIPTYMICDDHEITDDWFLDMHWCKTVLSSALGRRILQNGLTAYTLFQGWGNTPKQFSASSFNLGERLLTTMGQWQHGGYDQVDPASLLDANKTHDYWETMGIITGLPDLAASVAAGRLLPQNARRVDHHYYIRWENHEVIVLDTRTARGFPGTSDSDFAALISRESLRDQLAEFTTPATVEVTFIVIATPVSGVPNIEEALATTARAAAALPIAFENLEDHYFLLPFIDLTLVSPNDLSYLTDAEVYANQPIGLQDLYAAIGRAVASRQQSRPAGTPGRIVVLSGDVHYGFTNRVEFWADRFADMADTESRINTPAHFVMAQLCASALKNEKEKFIGSRGFSLGKSTGTYGFKSLDETGYTEDEILHPAIWLGWVPPAEGTKQVGDLDRPDVSPVVIKPIIIDKYDFAVQANKDLYAAYLYTNNQPDWLYRINYIKALPTPSGPQQVLAVSNPATGSAATYQQRAEALQNFVAAATNNKQYLLTDSPGSEAVGKNNLGEITFDWGTTEATKFVRHYLWWSKATRNGTDAQREAHSKFAVLLGQDAAHQRPTAPYNI